MNENGCSLKGLRPGIYTLIEKAAPAGYNILSNKTTFTVKPDGTVEYDNENNQAMFVAKGNESSDNVLTIKNTPGAALPATGGTGTLPYTIGGLTLFAFSTMAFVLYKRRRIPQI